MAETIWLRSFRELEVDDYLDLADDKWNTPVSFYTESYAAENAKSLLHSHLPGIYMLEPGTFCVVARVKRFSKFVVEAGLEQVSKKAGIEYKLSEDYLLTSDELRHKKDELPENLHKYTIELD